MSCSFNILCRSSVAPIDFQKNVDSDDAKVRGTKLGT